MQSSARKFGITLALIVLPAISHAAVINVYDNGNYWPEQTVDGFNALNLPNQTARLVDNVFANPAGTSMIVMSGHTELSIDVGRLHDYIAGGGRVFLWSDYNGATYPAMQDTINNVLAGLGTGLSVSGHAYGVPGGETTYNIASGSPFTENVSSTFYAASGFINGANPADVLVTGNQGQNLLVSLSIGDGYLFLSADTNMWNQQLMRNLATAGGTIVPIPAAIWLFGPALAGLGFLRRRQSS
jgi:hypothetical protein